MTTKHKSLFFIPASALVLLAGYFIIKNNQTASTVNDSAPKLDLSVNDSVSTTVLAIDPQRCIGCGHCVKFSPANFELNRSTRKAVVISSENSNSASVRQAINACPVAAISLN